MSLVASVIGIEGGVAIAWQFPHEEMVKVFCWVFQCPLHYPLPRLCVKPSEVLEWVHEKKMGQ
eukprot:4850894-Lingulodinium_polyedra.AAC.1